jgi:hypothetical protein
VRFVSAVVSHAAQLGAGHSLPPEGTAASQQAVHQSGRDLAANLSRHGQGVAYFAARELQQQIREITRLFSDNEITHAFGASDMWQVIEQVATLDLGGAPGLVRQRTRADTGATIIRWLASRRGVLRRPGPVIVLKDDDIRKRRTGKKRAGPTDYDLVNACDQWLAVADIPGTHGERDAEPDEPPGQRE